MNGREPGAKVILLLVGILVLALANAGHADTQQVARAEYDYSSPRASFASFQQAILRKDATGVVVHVWNIAQHWPQQMIYTGKSLPEAVEQFNSLESFSWAGVDSQPFEGELKLTEAKWTQELSREHLTEKNCAVTVCHLLVEWPEAGRQAKMDAYNFDGTQEWWFWPRFYERVKTFKSEKAK